MFIGMQQLSSCLVTAAILNGGQGRHIKFRKGTKKDHSSQILLIIVQRFKDENI
jgi:hypothetical protein